MEAVRYVGLSKHSYVKEAEYKGREGHRKICKSDQSGRTLLMETMRKGKAEKRKMRVPLLFRS